MKTLSKQDILAVKDQVIKQLDMSKWWPGSIYICSISAKERGLIEAAAARFKETKGRDDSFVRNFTLRMAGMAMCDENGKRQFSDDEIPQLSHLNAAAIAYIAEEAQKLAGLTKEDIEALAKNSEGVQPEGSLSA